MTLMMRDRLALGLTVSAVLTMAASVLGQTEDEDAVLAGPRVADRSGELTLVSRDYAGALKPLETSPEVAALELLVLEPEARTAVDNVLAERAALWDKVVRENIDLLVRFQTATAAGDRTEQGTLLMELAAELRDLRARGTLQNEISGLLTDDLAEPFDAIVDEYRAAVVQELVESSPEGLRLWQARRRVALQEMGQQIARAYDRVVVSASSDYEALLAKLALSTEQEAKIRRMVQEFGQETMLNPTQAQRRELLLRILPELTPEQRQILFREYSPTRSSGIEDR